MTESPRENGCKFRRVGGGDILRAHGAETVCFRNEKFAACAKRRSDLLRIGLTTAALLSFLQISSELTADAQPRKSPSRDFDSFGFSLLFRPGKGSDGSEYRDNNPNPKIDAELVKNPNDMYYLRMRATQLAAGGQKAKGIEVLKKAIKLQVDKNLRYGAPYVELAVAYRKAKNRADLIPLLKEMISRFPDNAMVLQEVIAHNRVLKDKDIKAKILVAVKKFNARKVVPKTLRDIKPLHPKPLKAGMCYQIIAETDNFPKFKIKLLPDRCVANTGVASYFVSPPTYERIILFNPETKAYATSTIMQLMKHHQGIRANRAESQYSSVQRVGNEAVNGHMCSVYKCNYWGDDNYDKVYFSDSISVLEPLAFSMAQICQTPYSRSVPMKAYQVIEGHSFEQLTMHTMTEVKAIDADYKLPEGSHRVSTLNDVIFDGEMMDSMFMSK